MCKVFSLMCQQDLRNLSKKQVNLQFLGCFFKKRRFSIEIVFWENFTHTCDNLIPIFLQFWYNERNCKMYLQVKIKLIHSSKEACYVWKEKEITTDPDN